MPKKSDVVTEAVDHLDELAENEAKLENEPLSVKEAIADARAQAGDALRAKLPDPKPGDPDYDWSGHYDTTDLYTHKFPDGTVVAIKPFASIYSKTWLYKIRQLQTDTDIEFAAIDRAACPTAQEVLMNLDDTKGDPFEDLYKAWLEAGTKNAEGDKGLTSGE